MQRTRDELCAGSDYVKFTFRPSDEFKALDESPEVKVCSIINPQGKVVVDSESMGFHVSSGMLTLVLDLSNIEDWPISNPGRGYWYKVLIEYETSSTKHRNSTEFAVVPDPWEPNITNDDLLSVDGGVAALTGGQENPSLAPWIEKAEREIRMRIRRGLGITAGYINGKTDLDILLVNLALHHYWASAQGVSDSEKASAAHYRALFEADFKSLMSRISTDDNLDGSPDDAVRSEAQVRSVI